MHIQISEVTIVPNILVLHYFIEESKPLTVISMKVYYLFLRLILSSRFYCIIVECHLDFIILHRITMENIHRIYIILWKTLVGFTSYYYGKSLLILRRVGMDNAH